MISFYTTVKLIFLCREQRVYILIIQYVPLPFAKRQLKIFRDELIILQFLFLLRLKLLTCGSKPKFHNIFFVYFTTNSHVESYEEILKKSIPKSIRVFIEPYLTLS